jgi:hypothetical protein
MPELDTSTLSATYVCTILTVILIFVRLTLRYHRKEEKHLDDLWMAISLAPLIIRLGVIHVVLVYGTTSFDRLRPETMSQTEIEHRIIGSKLILASRIFYAGL